MITNNPFNNLYPTIIANNNHTAQQLKKNAGTDHSFAAKLKEADESLTSSEISGPTDSIGIILRQMREPEAGGKVETTVIHNGASVKVTKDAVYGNTITIGGSSKPDWIQVSTSVGTVNIDLNDLDSLMKCLDMFSPEDINAILRKITEVRQSRDAMQEIDNMKNTAVEQAEKKEEEENE